MCLGVLVLSLSLSGSHDRGRSPRATDSQRDLRMSDSRSRILRAFLLTSYRRLMLKAEARRRETAHEKGARDTRGAESENLIGCQENDPRPSPGSRLGRLLGQGTIHTVKERPVIQGNS